MRRWLDSVERPVVIELGAGTHIPTVRMLSDATAAPVIRINPREAQVTHGRDVGLSVGALPGLRALNAALQVR